jgi:HEAT repeat protein
LTEREPGLRRRIVYAIGKTTRGDLAGLVEPFAADSDADVRLAVVRVLTDRPQTNRNGILKELAKDGDLAVRQAARFLLGVPGD